MVLHGDFSVVLGKDDAESELITGVLEIKIATSSTRSQSGDDGLGTLGGYVIFGQKMEYRGVIETVFALKQAA